MVTRHCQARPSLRRRAATHRQARLRESRWLPERARGENIGAAHVEGWREARAIGSIKIGTGVSSVEVIDVSHLSKSYKGLAFGFDDPEEVGFWQALDLSDQTLLVESADVQPRRCSLARMKDFDLRTGVASLHRALDPTDDPSTRAAKSQS